MANRITSHEAAKQLSISPNYFVMRVFELGYSKAKKTQEESRQKAKEVYDKLMAGTTLIELAEEYRTTVGNIGQWCLRHRRRTGAPPKKDWRKGKRKHAS